MLFKMLIKANKQIKQGLIVQFLLFINLSIGHYSTDHIKLCSCQEVLRTSKMYPVCLNVLKYCDKTSKSFDSLLPKEIIQKFPSCRCFQYNS